jgi:DNA-binding winged helix-turn-helix (wHTH) protein/tetratricopeptide (TPR) repeat protein
MAIGFLDFELDREKFELRRGGQVLRVEPRVLEVLLYLAENRGRVVTKQELIDRVWAGTIVSESALSRCIMEARKAIGDPDRAEPAIRTVHGRGYRFEMPEPSVEEAAAARSPAPLKERRRLAVWIGVAAAALVPLAAALSYPRWKRSEEPKSVRLAIIPISVNADDREVQLIAISLGDLLEQRLSRTPNMLVRGPDYTRAASINAISLAQFADQTASDSILSGTLRRSQGGDKVQLQMSLHQVQRSGRVHETPLGHYDIPLLRSGTDVSRYATIRDRIVSQITDTLLPAFRSPAADNLTPRNAEAYRLYLLARQRLGDGECNSDVSAELLRRSLDLDPDFAPAWEAYGWSQYGQASSCALNKEGYTRALDAANEALRLVPGYSSAIGLKATVLAETGRIEEAYEVLKTAEGRDPGSPDLQSFLFYVLDYSGYNLEARRHLEKLHEIDPNFLTLRGWTPNPYLYTGEIDRFLHTLPATDTPLFAYYRGLALFVGGRTAEARKVLEPSYEQFPNDPFSKLARALVAVIDRQPDVARFVLGEFVRQRAAVQSSDGEMRYKIAQLYALAGEQEAALRELRLAIEDGFFNVPYFQADPLMAGLRNDAAFARIVAKAAERHAAFGKRYSLRQ